MGSKPLSYYTATPAENIIAELDSTAGGLTHIEAIRRLKENGKNVLAGKKEYGAVAELLKHFSSPLILILLVAAAVSAALGERLDAFIIGIMVLLSVLLDFFLEHHAQHEAEKLKERVKAKAIVLRGGVKSELSFEDICAGDVLILSAGSLVPADCRLVVSKDFFVNQSALTGESYPAGKSSAVIKEKDISLTDMHNLVFMGTNVVSGSASALVVRTGKDTEFGKIADKLTKPEEDSEFDKGVKDFGILIMKATIILVLIIFLFNSFLKHKVLESFMFAIAVAVGLTPELLPMIMSIMMARGSLKMAAKGVIVKKLSSIPNFGSMDVLCTDKTGTLTEDKIQLVKYTDVLGNDSDVVLRHAYLNSSFQTGVVNPLDAAVLSFRKLPITGYRKIDEIPFDFARKRMSVIVRKGKKCMLITKGAPEEVFKCCSHYSSANKRLTAAAINRIQSVYHAYSAEGYRVLAVAAKELPEKKEFSNTDEKDLVLLGFVSFLDPAKADVKDVLPQLKKAGIEIKIITGDNELVTRKICGQIGLEIKGVMIGHELSSLTDDALKVRVENTTIFARFSPDEKNRVISALRAGGHVVGYMGDGINDAPSLRTADIGISVNSAVDVAKESADIVLTRKSLASLIDGVLEGRKTFANTLKYIMMGLSSNFGNMFSVAVAVLFLPFLPMLPIQILLNNFIYDFSQVTIPTDNVDKEYIQKPRRWSMGFIQRFMMAFGPISSVFDLLTFGLLFLFFKVDAAAFQTGWFIESLATQTLVIHVIRTRQTPFLESTASPKLLATSFGCVALGWLLPYTPIGRFFGFVVLPPKILLSIAGLVAVYLIIVELVKKAFYKYNDI